MFLVGRCSCRMKNENPGWDLLLNVDWDQALAIAGQSAAAEPAAATAAAKPPAEPEAVTTPQTVTLEPVAEAAGSSTKGWAIAAALLLALAARRLLRRRPKD